MAVDRYMMSRARCTHGTDVHGFLPSVLRRRWLRNSRMFTTVALISLMSFSLTVLGLLGHMGIPKTKFVAVNDFKNVTTNNSMSRPQEPLAMQNSTERNFSRDGKAKEEPAPTVSHRVSDVVEMLRHHYGNDTEKIFRHLERLAGQEWVPNATRLQRFRGDIRLELGRNGSLERFILTKKNTPSGTKFGFYMHGRPQKISRILWQNLPNDVIFKSGQFASCSVVGSSGILRGSGCGKEIDRSQGVFRFNVAPVAGFEADVGSKTNLTTLNPSFVVRKLNSLKTRKDVNGFGDILKQFKGSQLFLPAFAVVENTAVITRMSRNAFNSKMVRPVLGHPQHFLAVSKLWRETTVDTHTWPTTGLYLILSLFDVCDQISLFGFWPYETAINGSQVPYHYHDNITARFNVHRFDAEFKSLVNLYEQGVLNMTLESCL